MGHSNRARSALSPLLFFFLPYLCSEILTFLLVVKSQELRELI